MSKLNSLDNTADNVDGPAGLLRRILTYSVFGMAASVAIQFVLLLLGFQVANTIPGGQLTIFGVSTAFFLMLLIARRLAYQDRKALSLYWLFAAICFISVLVVVALPSALGLALVAPTFGLFLAIPFVSRGAFKRMSLITIGLALIIVPISAILAPSRPAPTSQEILVQSLPLVIAAVAVVILAGLLQAWMAGTMRALRDAQINLEAKVAERTIELMVANKALTTEVSQRALIQQHLSVQAEYLSALHELSLGVINCLDRETMLDAIVSRACQLLDTPNAFIGLLDDESSHVSISVAKGVFEDMMARGGQFLPTQTGSVGQTGFTGGPLIIDDYDVWAHRLDVVPAGINACAIYPMHIHENKVAGVLVVAYTEPDRIFDADKKEAIGRLAELASIAYSNILLYEAVRQNEQVLELGVAERTRELSTLLGVAQNLAGTLNLPLLLKTVFQQLHRLVNFDSGAIFEVREDAMAILHYDGPIEQQTHAGTNWRLSGHHLEIALSGRPIIIDDVRSDDPMAVLFRTVSMTDWLGEVPAQIISWIGVPMKVKDRVIGILTLDSAQPQHFNERHAELLTAVAQQAALAIENAQLYIQAAQSAAQAERSRLARDLHDSVSQAIYGIVLATRTLEKLADPHDTRIAAPLHHILTLSDAAMAEIRALIFELRPESLEREGVLAALSKQAYAIRARYGLQVEIDMCGAEPQVSLQLKEAVYRIALEAMHNSVKHANAQHL